MTIPSTSETAFTKEQIANLSHHRIGNPNKIYDHMNDLRRRVASAKPRSRRRIELEFQLRDLTTKCLRIEMRNDRRTA